MEAQHNEGEIVAEGRNDILARVLKKKELSDQELQIKNISVSTNQHHLGNYIMKSTVCNQKWKVCVEGMACNKDALNYKASDLIDPG